MHSGPRRPGRRRRRGGHAPPIVSPRPCMRPAQTPAPQACPEGQTSHFTKHQAAALAPDPRAAQTESPAPGHEMSTSGPGQPGHLASTCTTDVVTWGQEGTMLCSDPHGWVSPRGGGLPGDLTLLGLATAPLLPAPDPGPGLADAALCSESPVMPTAASLPSTRLAGAGHRS